MFAGVCADLSAEIKARFASFNRQPGKTAQKCTALIVMSQNLVGAILATVLH